MRRALLALLFATAGLVLGCGGDDDPFGSYCDVVKEQQQPLSEALAQGASTGLLAALPSFEKLRDAAPDDIADEWAVVIQRIRVLRDALDEAGVDAATYDAEKPPPDVSEEQQAAIAAAANGLATPSTTAALSSVEQQARDVCRTQLSL